MSVFSDPPAETDFEVDSLEEAAKIKFPHDDQFAQACFLLKIHRLITQHLNKPGWTSTNPTNLLQWKDMLVGIFLNEKQNLSEYLPGCQSEGWTHQTMLWVIICGLYLLEQRWNDGRPQQWYLQYKENKTPCSLKHIVSSFLVISRKPVCTYSADELLGSLFTLTTRFYELEYHCEIEQWTHWLIMRCSEVMYGCGSKEVYDASGEYCRICDGKSDLYEVTPSFAAETCRVFCDILQSFDHFCLYERNLVRLCWNNEQTKLHIAYEPTEFPDWKASCESEDSVYSEDVFFGTTETQRRMQKTWTNFITDHILPLYHTRIRLSWYKFGLGQTLRPGEISRCKQNNSGTKMSHFQIIKTCRASTVAEYLDTTGFSASKQQVLDYFIDLEAKHCNQLMDFLFLYLIDLYLYNTTSCRFISEYCVQEHMWDWDYIERAQYPLLVQIMGRWDVYHSGTLYNTRSAKRAFLVWVILVQEKHNGTLKSLVDLTKVIALLTGRYMEKITPIF